MAKRARDLEKQTLKKASPLPPQPYLPCDHCQYELSLHCTCCGFVLKATEEKKARSCKCWNDASLLTIPDGKLAADGSSLYLNRHTFMSAKSPNETIVQLKILSCKDEFTTHLQEPKRDTLPVLKLTLAQWNASAKDYYRSVAPYKCKTEPKGKAHVDEKEEDETEQLFQSLTLADHAGLGIQHPEEQQDLS